MDKKKSLTQANKVLKEKQNKRSDLERKLQTFQERLISVASTIQAEKKRIELNEHELVDREDTLNEKRERILSLKKKI
jgi:uncharacterized protein (DUF3084 family)